MAASGICCYAGLIHMRATRVLEGNFFPVFREGRACGEGPGFKVRRGNLAPDS